MKISISYINQGFQKYPSSQLSPALVEQFASFAWTFLASSRLALSPSQPVPFPVASFIASSASAKVEAALLFLFFISFPQLSTLLASLNSTWALLNFFVFATRSAKQVSCLPLARSPPCLLIDFCFLTFFSLFFSRSSCSSFYSVSFCTFCLHSRISCQLPWHPFLEQDSSLHCQHPSAPQGRTGKDREQQERERSSWLLFEDLWRRWSLL